EGLRQVGGDRRLEVRQVPGQRREEAAGRGGHEGGKRGGRERDPGLLHQRRVHQRSAAVRADQADGGPGAEAEGIAAGFAAAVRAGACMRMSRSFTPTLKEVPADALVASHQFLVRAGYIRQPSAGIYSILPLGQRSILKITEIVRAEMNAIGGQEFYLPALNPREI